MINGTLLMQILVCVYVVVAVIFGYEGDWPKAAYWVGAAIITSSVVFMK